MGIIMETALAEGLKPAMGRERAVVECKVVKFNIMLFSHSGPSRAPAERKMVKVR